MSPRKSKKDHQSERISSTFKDSLVVSIVDVALIQLIIHTSGDSGLGGTIVIMLILVVFPAICLILLIIKNLLAYKNFMDFIIKIFLSTMWISLDHLILLLIVK